MDRLTSGVPHLDELIEGGIKKGTINLVAGEAGSGKSTFATHFITAGAKAGEKGLYISIEEKKEKFIENMGRYGFELKKLEESGEVIFHKSNVVEIRNFLDQGVVAFEEYFREGDVKRVVIDSITALMLAYNEETSQRNSLMQLFELLERWGATVLVTSEIDDGQARFGIEYLVDGIFRLYYRKIGQERVRTLEVFKMRGTNHTNQEIVYRLAEKGILLYPDEKILA